MILCTHTHTHLPTIRLRSIRGLKRIKKRKREGEKRNDREGPEAEVEREEYIEKNWSRQMEREMYRSTCIPLAPLHSSLCI